MGTIVTLGYEVTWEDGSEASFRLLLTVEDPGLQDKLASRVTAVEPTELLVWSFAG